MKTLELVSREAWRRAVAALLLASSMSLAQEPPPHGRGQRRGPPPEALSACEGKAAGAACSFTHESHAITGTCFAPEGRPLACRPDRPPPGGGEPPGQR